jgi:hypothetical protein
MERGQTNVPFVTSRLAWLARELRLGRGSGRILVSGDDPLQREGAFCRQE